MKTVKKKVVKDDDWEKAMEEEAETESSREKAGGGAGNMLSIKGRKFTFGGEKIGRELKCVVVDSVYLNAWYKKKYKTNQGGGIPQCFALSAEQEGMKPHKNSTMKQAKICAKCPKNEWGSGNKGDKAGSKRGPKACRQGRKLAIMAYEDMGEKGDRDSVKEAAVAILSMPPTTTRNWGTYVKDVRAKYGRPFWAVVTKITFDEDMDYPVLEFEAEEKLDKSRALVVKKRHDEFRDLLLKPFEPADAKDDDEDEDEDEDDDKPKKKVGKKAGNKPDADDDDDDDADTDDLDEEDDDLDDEDEDEPKSKKKKKKDMDEEELEDDEEEDDDEDSDESDDDDGDDDDEEDEEEEDDEEDEDEEEEPVKRKKRKGSRFGK